MRAGLLKKDIFFLLAFLLSGSKIFLSITKIFAYISLTRTESHAHPWTNHYKQRSDFHNLFKPIIIHPLGLGTFTPEQKTEVY